MRTEIKLSRVASGLMMIGALVLFLLALPVGAQVGKPTTVSYDPVTMDPPILDADLPPGMVETGFDSHGVRLNAILYLTQGPGPHPVVVLLHGFPGNEKNLDLAQALRRSGSHVLFFHYRGSWGSAGSYSLGHNVEDVHSALEHLRSPQVSERHRIDVDRIALVGHSVGGFTALLAAATDPSIRCTASIAGINLGRFHEPMRASPEEFKSIAEALQGGTGPLRGTSGVALATEIVDQGASFDLLTHIDALAERDLLLIAGQRDRVVPVGGNHEPLVTALEEKGRGRVTQALLATDHGYSGHRIALARTVIGWLKQSCEF